MRGTTKVWVDYSQYWVAAGPAIDARGELVPGLLSDLGPQAFAVTTGRQSGNVRVRAAAVSGPPAKLDPHWDVIAETDLECAEGVISVLDWGGPDHEEFGDLAIAGPGRYRVRVHAKNREPAGDKRSTEEYSLVVWPVAEAAPSRLLTPMDAFGRAFIGRDEPDEPPMDELELAAAAAVRELAALVARCSPADLSGDLTVVRARTIAPGSARKVWGLVTAPWNWVGTGGIGDPDDYHIYMCKEPEMTVGGSFTLSEPPTRLTFTWSWTTARFTEVDKQVLYDSWCLPRDPTTVHITLNPQGKGSTLVELEHRHLPVELADQARPFWDWALRELGHRLTKEPFYGLPWDR